MKKVLALALVVCGLASAAQASPTSGSNCQIEAVRAHTTDVYNVVFRGGQLGSIFVDGDGDTDLDVYVYDEFGNLIASDADGSDVCLAQFVPTWTGNFTIRVVNRGSVYNRYEICFG